MSREIKFRAWYEPLNRMFYDVAMYYHPWMNNYRLKEKKLHKSYVSWEDIEKPWALEEDSTELMQFTGLHDKNGTEIYEGDILKVESRRKKTSKWWKEPEIMVCHWVENYGGFMFCNPNQKPESKLFGGCLTLSVGNDYMYQRSTILGNCFENPELLGAEK